MFTDALKDLKNKFKNNTKRLNHILGVFETALKLAKHYNVDIYSVGLAALYHDYHKDEDYNFYLSYLNESDLKKYKNYPFMYHALAAKKTLQTKYPNLNKDAYKAVKNHVFGNKNMSVIEKIIFISDYAEPSRTYFNPNKILNIAYNDLDKALIKCLNITINNLNDKNLKVHQMQKDVYNYYKEKE